MPKRRRTKKAIERIPEDHLDAILVYVTKLIVMMGLPIYRVLIMEKYADKGTAAQIKPTDDRHIANLFLSKRWMQFTDDEQRETITHEVLHLWHRHLTDWFRSEVHDLVQFHEYIRLERQYDHLVEMMVDNIAMILADTHRLKEEWEEAHGGKSYAAPAVLEGAVSG